MYSLDALCIGILKLRLKDLCVFAAELSLMLSSLMYVALLSADADFIQRVGKVLILPTLNFSS